MPSEEITVLGAGVIGLTCALLFAQEGYRVRVLAKYFNNDPINPEYCSNYAGANHRSVVTAQDVEMCRYETDTLRYFRILAEKEPHLVRQCRGIDYFDAREPDGHDKRSPGEELWFQSLCSVKEINDQAVKIGAIAGIEFNTVVVNTPDYLEWLRLQCLETGIVQFERKEITNLKDVDCRGRIVVNALGLGTAKVTGILHDDKSYPIRGQTVLVENTTQIADTYSRVGPGTLSYLIPRPNGGLIIGGCQQPDNWDTTVDQDLAQKILKDALCLYGDLFPKNHSFNIIRHNVGLRPARKGGVRVELERSDKIYVIHAYGIAGWGVQSSYGIALRVADLARGMLE